MTAYLKYFTASRGDIHTGNKHSIVSMVCCDRALGEGLSGRRRTSTCLRESGKLSQERKHLTWVLKAEQMFARGINA